MKLILAIIHDDDAQGVMDDLRTQGYSATKLASSGSFLRLGNTTLLCGVEDDQIDPVTHIIQNRCKERTQQTPIPLDKTSVQYRPFSVEVTVGGATIFVLNVENFIKI